MSKESLWEAYLAIERRVKSISFLATVACFAILGFLITGTVRIDDFWTKKFWGGPESNLAEIIRNLAIAAGVFGAAYGLWLRYQQTQTQIGQTRTLLKQTDIQEATLVTEQFNRAVEQLNNEKITSRIGGIYTLWQIAENHPNGYYKIVLNLFSAFIRSYSTEELFIDADEDGRIEAPKEWKIITDLYFRRSGSIRTFEKSYSSEERSENRLDLTGSNFSQIKFNRFSFQKVDIRGCDFSDSALTNCICNGTEFDFCRLENTIFSGTTLHKADMIFSFGTTTNQFLTAKYDETTFFPDHIDKNKLFPDTESL